MKIYPVIGALALMVTGCQRDNDSSARKLIEGSSEPIETAADRPGTPPPTFTVRVRYVGQGDSPIKEVGVSLTLKNMTTGTTTQATGKAFYNQPGTDFVIASPGGARTRMYAVITRQMETFVRRAECESDIRELGSNPDLLVSASGSSSGGGFSCYATTLIN